jgi:hypothetical protein
MISAHSTCICPQYVDKQERLELSHNGFGKISKHVDNAFYLVSVVVFHLDRYMNFARLSV